MWGGGSSTDEAGGGDLFVLHIISLEVGMVAIWGDLGGAWGLTMVQVVHVSPCMLPSSSYSGCLG